MSAAVIDLKARVPVAQLALASARFAGVNSMGWVYAAAVRAVELTCLDARDRMQLKRAIAQEYRLGAKEGYDWL